MLFLSSYIILLLHNFDNWSHDRFKIVKNRLILTACQHIKGYFMPRSQRIVFIVHFCVVISKVFFVHDDDDIKCPYLILIIATLLYDFK